MILVSDSTQFMICKEVTKPLAGRYEENIWRENFKILMPAWTVLMRKLSFINAFI